MMTCSGSFAASCHARRTSWHHACRRARDISNVGNASASDSAKRGRTADPTGDTVVDSTVEPASTDESEGSASAEPIRAPAPRRKSRMVATTQAGYDDDIRIALELSAKEAMVDAEAAPAPEPAPERPPAAEDLDTDGWC